MPLPMELRLDATSALAFMSSTATRSKMRHIDLRSEWVTILRDKKIFTGKYCPSEALFADLGTKIQGPQKFGPLRDGMYFSHALPSTPLVQSASVAHTPAMQSPGSGSGLRGGWLVDLRIQTVGVQMGNALAEKAISLAPP